MRHLLLLCGGVCLASFTCAQNYEAPIIHTWAQIANDAQLTYAEITTNCDSQFAAAGFFPGMTLSVPDEVEGAPYGHYLRWKEFWAPRLDAGTGKLHRVAGMMGLLAPGTIIDNCREGSALQSSLPSYVPGGHGWHWIGPKNNTGASNTLNQALGRVTSICVNPFNRNVAYIANHWGGVWKSTNATTTSPTWTCVTDNNSTTL